MARAGWSKLILSEGWLRGSATFRIDAYSEFMPPPRVGWKPYGPVSVNPYLFSPDDPFGWKVHEFDEALELQPGLHRIAKDLMTRLKRLQDGNPDTGLPRHISRNNPFWPPELASASLQNDPCVLLLPLALSRTQDDKGRVRWTLFGNSEQGPGKAFARGRGAPRAPRLPQRPDGRRAGQRQVRFLLAQMHQAYYFGWTESACILAGTVLEQALILRLERRMEERGPIVSTRDGAERWLASRHDLLDLELVEMLDLSRSEGILREGRHCSRRTRSGGSATWSCTTGYPSSGPRKAAGTR